MTPWLSRIPLLQKALKATPQRHITQVWVEYVQAVVSQALLPKVVRQKTYLSNVKSPLKGLEEKQAIARVVDVLEAHHRKGVQMPGTLPDVAGDDPRLRQEHARDHAKNMLHAPNCSRLTVSRNQFILELRYR